MPDFVRHNFWDNYDPNSIHEASKPASPKAAIDYQLNKQELEIFGFTEKFIRKVLQSPLVTSAVLCSSAKLLNTGIFTASFLEKILEAPLEEIPENPQHPYDVVTNVPPLVKDLTGRGMKFALDELHQLMDVYGHKSLYVLRSSHKRYSTAGFSKEHYVELFKKHPEVNILHALWQMSKLFSGIAYLNPPTLSDITKLFLEATTLELTNHLPLDDIITTIHPKKKFKEYAAELAQETRSLMKRLARNQKISY